MFDPAPFLIQWRYLALALVILLGNGGLPVPEETILILAGYLVWDGHLQWLPTLLVGVLSAAAGDTVGYWLGRLYGRRAVERYALRLVRTPERLTRIRGFLHRYGACGIVAARFLPGLRFLGGPLAGAVGLPLGMFVPANLLGAALFVPYAVGLGYAVGHGFGGHVARVWQIPALLAYGVIIVAIAGLSAASRRLAHARPDPQPPPTPRSHPEVNGARGARRWHPEWLWTARQAVPRFFTLVRQLQPTVHLPSVRAIDEAFLHVRHIEAIIWDVDGTLMTPGAPDMAADRREHVRRLFRSSRVRHAIVSNCGEVRYQDLGRLFPEVPVVGAYTSPEGTIYRVLHEGRERWEPSRPPSDTPHGFRPLRKPNAAIIHFVVKLLQRPPETVVMVGDQYFTDIAGANLAGIRSIKVPTLGRAHFPVGVRWFQRAETALYAMLSAQARR